MLLPRFGQPASTLDLFFFMLHTFLHINFASINLFYLVAEFFMLCLTRFVLDFICLQISCLDQFAIIRFRFFWRRCLFYYILFAYTHLCHTVHTFGIPKFPRITPSLSTIAIVVTFLVFHFVQTSQNVPFSAIWGSFFLVFVSLLANASIRAHQYRSSPI